MNVGQLRDSLQGVDDGFPVLLQVLLEGKVKEEIEPALVFLTKGKLFIVADRD